MSDINELLREFNREPFASDEAIKNASESIEAELPNDYIAFLLKNNGGEGMIGKSYVILWKAEELATMNKAYQVEEYAPGLLLIGSDGGGEAFAFDTRKIPWPVVKVPFIGMELQYATLIAPSFNSFLQTLADE